MKHTNPRRENAPFPESLRADGIAPEEQDAVWALLDEWKPGEPSESFDAAVMARIREDGDSHSGLVTDGQIAGLDGWLGGFRAWLAGLGPVRGFGLAGALAMILLAAVMLRQPVAPGESPESTTAGQEFTAQQAEMALEDLQMLDELYNAPIPEETQNKKI
jgi:hypothetical protein